MPKKVEETVKFICLTEENEWEGETWYHYFLAEPGVFDILAAIAQNGENDFEGLEEVAITWPEATRLTNHDHGEYMQLHWFGKLTKPEELKKADSDALYKGGIRKFGEELFVREEGESED